MYLYKIIVFSSYSFITGQWGQYFISRRFLSIYKTIHCHNPEYSNFSNHRHVNRKNCKHVICLKVIEHAESCIEDASPFYTHICVLTHATSTHCYCVHSPRTANIHARACVKAITVWTLQCPFDCTKFIS
jgi:hypothetical protein